MARPATPRDPYDVLGVPRSADDTQIKKAFRALARELHPDVLIIPELVRDDHTYHTAYWAHTAPYFEVKQKNFRTPAPVRDVLTGAFSVVNVGDGDLDKNRAEIKAGVAAGDVLMFRGWFPDKRNEWVKKLYDEGKLAVVQVDSGKLTNLGEVPSAEGDHSVAVDSRTHTVWIAYAKGDTSYVQPFILAKP